MSGNHYDAKNLPLRTHKNYIYSATIIEQMNGSLRKREIQE